MNIFKKIFGNTSEDDKDSQGSPYEPEINTPIDEKFTFNFKNNGGKFLYCENLNELREQFENILEENDWFESQVLCHDDKLFSLLDENKLVYKDIETPKFFFTICEDLISDDGSILFSSKQFKQYKANELPCDMVVFATTSQIVGNKSDGLRNIKKRYDKDYPSNITTIKYFEKAKEEDFLHYGSSHKNLYLLLLEDL
ncbi:lactate utilization protein B/C [uncultured Flavobacterium sp.]|uniref:lactate utilization protein B/C n=1 Tax=uncultured Flavobacterium sp. TaxID=165435 RepID=UPI0030EDEDF4|tara:strand:+ start:41544 stop:42137 length:594 start_codon:yes stop_codon:yes gene_type:complete